MQEGKKLTFNEEPNVWLEHDKTSVRSLFVWAAKNKVNDINIATGKKISVQMDGEIYMVTRKKMTAEDVKNILYVLYESESARASILSGEDKDFAFQVRSAEDSSVYRFRVNVTGIMVGDAGGMHITARIINSSPPRMEDLDMEAEIVKHCIDEQGIVVFAGSTGTGKTTSLASMIRWVLENNKMSKKIVTFEAPIEFIYDYVPSEKSIIYQSEVDKNIPSFARAIRGALRRSPDIILIGEARDAETIGQSITASQSGHLILTTTHTNGVSETIKRMVNEFPADERNARAFDLITSLNMIVSQKLVKKEGGGRTALREYLVFTKDIKRRLQTCDIDTLSYHCQEELKKHGQTFFMSAKSKLEAGIISAETFEDMRLLYDATEKDIKNTVVKVKE